MEKIYEHLRDPSWWFDLVCVGIIVSAIGGVITDRVRRSIAGIKTAAQLRQNKRALRISFLEQHPSLLAMELSLTTHRLIAWVVMLVAFTSSFTMAREVTSAWLAVSLRVLSLAMGVMTAIAAFPVSSNVSLVADAYDRTWRVAYKKFLVDAFKAAREND